jgi:hypothetical protein
MIIIMESEKNEELEPSDPNYDESSNTCTGYSIDITSYDIDDDQVSPAATDATPTENFAVTSIAEIEEGEDCVKHNTDVLLAPAPTDSTPRENAVALTSENSILATSAEILVDEDEECASDEITPTTVEATSGLVMEAETMQPADAMEYMLPTTDSETAVGNGEFVNLGLATWEKNRQIWLHKSANRRDPVPKHAKPIQVDEIIDAIFTTPKKLVLNGGISEIFPQSVPLPQLVDILQDLWEAESL